MKNIIENYKLKIENCKLWIVMLVHFSFFIFHFSIFNPTAWADPPVAPTLARLSFWVPPQRMAEFEAAYEAKVVPILKAHGLTESSERGRATPDSIFTRMFEFRTPTELIDKQTALQEDATWTVALRDLGVAFGTSQPDSLIRNEFLLYTAPTGPGKVVSAGSGKVTPAGLGTGHWRTYDVTDGLVNAAVPSMLQDREGNLWFGSWGGVSRYDGKTFTTFTEKDVAGSPVRSIFQDREGHFWFGTDDGVSRYNGRASGHRFVAFTKEDGLASNRIRSIFQDQEGHHWFSTGGGGVSRYDGKVFQTLSQQDGLADNSINAILQDRSGDLWFSTVNGVTRYRKPARVPPPIYIDAVVADQRYEKASSLRVPSTIKLTAFEFHAVSFKTRPEAMVYRYRLNGYDKDWRTTHQRRVEYQNLPRGNYTFEVVAVDRDLVYSEKPATVMLQIHPPYTLFGLVAALGIALGLAAWQTARVVRRDRRLREANAALSAANKELFGLNRQATRRGAVDRMRAEVGAMRASVDLERITPTIWKELRELRVPFLRCGVFIIEEQEKRLHAYLTNPEGASLGVLSLAFDSHPVVSRAVNCWRTKEAYAEEWDRQALLEWVQFLEAQGQPIRRERYLDSEAPPESLALRHVPFAQGILYVGSAAPLPEEDVDLMRDLANAFSIAYARYMDFQKLEAQNRQIQEANRLKSQFLANMSHELRTPMNAIIGFTNLVLRRAGDVLPERQRDNLTKVKLSADHLLNLINDILDLSKIEAGRVDIQKKWFDMRELIAGCCATVSPLVKEGVALTHEVAGDVREAYSDEARLRQVIINLLSNALKFTEKGEVKVLVTRQASLVARSEALEIAVSDTGIGIPADALGYIFDEFRQVDGSSTRQYGGTGLGLSITKKLTELMGGTIGVESAVGKGSTFTVRIPVVYDERRGDPRGRPSVSDQESPSAVSRLTSHGDEEEKGGRTIVVIDDDPNAAALLRQELAEEGYRVVGALNADDGVALARRIRPAAVTVDIIMPGKDGWETIAMLKGDPETRDIPIIVISASDNRELGYRLGVRDYLVKPIDREALLSVLGRLDSGQLKDILVVDDEPLVTTMICQMLEFSGFAARSASNGEEALAQIGRARPDAVLLDLMMPVMDGFEVIERLQADPTLRKVPVVVVTAKDLTKAEREFLQRRVSRVIQKGRMDPMALTQDLREMLKGYER